jgi:hypothetical protein
MQLVTPDRYLEELNRELPNDPEYSKDVPPIEPYPKGAKGWGMSGTTVADTRFNGIYSRVGNIIAKKFAVGI